jgi:hypothetical protein
MHSYGVRTSALKSQTCLARMTIDRMGMKIVEKYLGVPKKEARGAKRGGASGSKPPKPRPPGPPTPDPPDPLPDPTQIWRRRT